MRTWIATGLAAALLWAHGAAAQTTTAQPTTTPATTTEGAFDRLSPGNQRIARALFEAQPEPGATAGPTPLTLDEIAARKLDGQGWGNVFKDMKAQGLVQDRNLGQVVSRWSRQHGGSAASSGTLITTASGRTRVVGGPGRWDRDTTAPGRDDGAGRDARRGGHERAEYGGRDGAATGAGAAGRHWGSSGEGGRHGGLATTGRGGERGGHGRGK